MSASMVCHRDKSCCTAGTSDVILVVIDSDPGRPILYVYTVYPRSSIDTSRCRRNALQLSENGVGQVVLLTANQGQKKSPSQRKLKRAFPAMTTVTSGRQSGLAGTRKSETLETISIRGSAYAAKASYVLASRLGAKPPAHLPDHACLREDTPMFSVRRPVEFPPNHHSGTGAKPCQRGRNCYVAGQTSSLHWRASDGILT